MRYKAVKCDICGRDMTNDDCQYKFKRGIEHTIFVSTGVCKETRVWDKLDMCEFCYQDLKSFVAGNNQLRKDGQSPIVISEK